MGDYSDQGARWKSREVFSGLRVPIDSPLIVRVDGWRFHKVSEELGLCRPFDERLIKALSQVPLGLIRIGFPLALSFLFSDEISFLIYPPIPWNGRVEKLISVIPSYSSAVVSTALSYPVCFDARIVVIRNLEDVLDYLGWRQSEAWRNALNSYALLALERAGLRREDAVRELKGKKAEQLHEIIFDKLGINIAKVPSWQRRGIVVRKGYEEKGSSFKRVARKVPLIDWEIPLFSTPEGRDYLMESLRIYEESSR